MKWLFPPVLPALFATILAGRALAQTTLPEPLDPATARGALAALFTALKAGDVAAANQLLLFADAREEERVTVSLTTLWAPLGLMHALEARFGEGARKLFSNASLVAAADETLEKVRTADIVVTGDSAAVGERKAAVDPNAETEITGMKLQKVGRGWKIVAATFQDAAGDVPANQQATLQALSDATAGAAATVKKRVQAGEFTSADEAYKAYQTLLQSSARTTIPPPSAIAPAR